MSSDEVYSLCLSTYPTQPDPRNIPIDRSSLADVSWRVNWDEIIPQEKLSEYKYCRVRFNLSFGAKTLVWNTQLGYLGANFQSDYNAPTTCMPNILGVLYPQNNPTNAATNQVITRTTLYEIGVDINLNSLRGQQVLQLKMCNDDAFTTMSNIDLDWEIALYFQLYN
jgi:hypothetical protein